MLNNRFLRLECRWLLLALCLLTSWLGAVDLDRLFPQILADEFMSDLRKNEGIERAVFVAISGQERIFYLRFAAGHFLLRGSLHHADEKILAAAVRQAPVTVFAPLKQNGVALYRKGAAWRGTFNDGARGEFLYVPHLLNGSPNDAFFCDLGYLQIDLGESCCRNDLKAVFSGLFAGRAELMSQVRLNRYYLYRDNYLGPVAPVEPAVARDVLFDPLHKATLNKGIDDWHTKIESDKQLVIDLLARERFLLSQDMRLKLGMVPAAVEIRWDTIENTDIGSGQNQLVFLSLGSGINYFDDPWQQARRNVPCPRLIFHRDVCGLADMQIFPTYSIEPAEKGEGRLRAINSFQLHREKMSDADRIMVWPVEEFKKQYFLAVEEALCRQGLIDDSVEMKPGFALFGRKFAGNLVNNELRVHQSVSVRDSLTAVIVPKGTTDSYRAAYVKEMANSAPHWDYNCGIHYQQLFVEAPVSTDKGFRAAWLRLMLRRSHPELVRLMQLADGKRRDGACLILAEKIAAIAARQGRGFFITPYYQHFMALDTLRSQKWLAYLEAYREAEYERARSLLNDYKDFYEYLESVCVH